MNGKVTTDIAPGLRAAVAGGIPNTELPETTLQLSIGSKLIPTLPIRGRQQLPFLAMALGLESKREGFLNHLSWKHNKNVWGDKILRSIQALISITQDYQQELERISRCTTRDSACRNTFRTKSSCICAAPRSWS